MKVQLVRVGVIGALALVLMASRCSGDGETGKLETTGDVPEEVNAGTANDSPAAAEPMDPLGDPFSSVPDSEDPALEPDPMNDDGSTFEDPSFEPEAVPEDAEL
jgi:hypothetical protein